MANWVNQRLRVFGSKVDLEDILTNLQHFKLDKTFLLFLSKQIK